MNRFPLLLALLPGLLACSPSGGSPVPPLPTGPAYIAGVVTAVGEGVVRVEESPDQSAGSPKADLRLAPATVILWRSGDPADARDLRLGTMVRVWVGGPIAESYPVQATADTVVIDAGALPGGPGA